MRETILEDDSPSGEVPMTFRGHLNEIRRRIFTSVTIWMLASIIIIPLIDAPMLARIGEATSWGSFVGFPYLILQAMVFVWPGIKQQERSRFFIVFGSIALLFPGTVLALALLLQFFHAMFNFLPYNISESAFPLLMSKAIVILGLVSSCLLLTLLSSLTTKYRSKMYCALFGWWTFCILFFLTPPIISGLLLALSLIIIGIITRPKRL